MSVRLDHVCHVLMGQAPSGESYNNQGIGLPLLAGAGDFDGDRPRAKKFTTQVTKESLPGDLILGIRASIGDKVIGDRPYCLGRGVAGLRPKNGLLDDRYLWHWLTHVRPTLERKAKGATFKQVNREDIGELKIDLPTPEDQRRIAAILDKAEQLRTKVRNTIALLGQLPQAIFLEMFGDPILNPLGWPLSQVGEVADVQGGLQVSISRRGLPTEVPYLRVANVYRGYLSLAEIKTIRATDAEIKRTMLKQGDLLVVEGHGNPAEIGRAAIWDGSIRPCVHQNHLIRVRFDDSSVLPSFGSEYINSPFGRRHLLRSGKTTSGLNTINVSDVRATPIAVPPLALQYLYAERLKMATSQLLLHNSALQQWDCLFSSLQGNLFNR